MSTSSIYNTIIVAGFPGIGKSFFTANYDSIKCADSDSSKFSWLYDKEGNRTLNRNPNFIEDYKNHINELRGKKEVIFTSTHPEVLEMIYSCMVGGTSYDVPDRVNKHLYLELYRNRGNTTEFINMMEKNWDKFQDDVENFCQHHTFMCHGVRLKRKIHLDEELLFDLIKTRYDEIDSKNIINY